MKRVSLLGFSANPPTDFTGHGGIIQHLINSGDYDEIWLVPVYVHIYSTKRNLERFEHRYEMCNQVAIKLSTSKVTVKASDLERTVYLDAYNKHLSENPLGDPNVEVKVGSIDIIRYIRANYKDCNLLSINLGADSYNDLVNGKWKQHILILSDVCINVFKRQGFIPPLPAPAYAKGVKEIQLKFLSNTSSTAVRASQPGLFADYPFQFQTFIDQHKRTVPIFGEVYDYIRENQLYFYSPHAVQERLKWRIFALAATMCILCGLFTFAHLGKLDIGVKYIVWNI